MGRIGQVVWNKGVKTGIKPWLGKKRPDLKNTDAAKTMFRKGFVPWNTGKKWDDETKAKMSASRIGKAPWNRGLHYKMPQNMGENHPNWKGGNYKNCPDCEQQILKRSNYCLNCFQKGERGSNWQGGISKINHRLRQEQKARFWAKAVLKRDNYICQICEQVGGDLHADHIKRWADYPELRYELSNGRTLCVECHKQTPTWGNKPQVVEEVVFHDQTTI